MKCFTEAELLELLRQAYSMGYFSGGKRPDLMLIAQREKELAELISGGKRGRADA